MRAAVHASGAQSEESVRQRTDEHAGRLRAAREDDHLGDITIAAPQAISRRAVRGDTSYTGAECVMNW